MFRVRKYHPRRAEIRKNRPDLAPVWQTITRPQVLTSLGIALGFWMAIVAISTLRERMVRYRVGDYAQEDILSRVEFRYINAEREADLKKEARELAPRVYRADTGAFAKLETTLIGLPGKVTELHYEQLSPEERLPAGVITQLKRIQIEGLDQYKKWVKAYIQELEALRDKGRLVVLSPEEWDAEFRSQRAKIKVQGIAPGSEFNEIDKFRISVSRKPENNGDAQRTALLNLFAPLADQSFVPPLSASIAGLTADTIQPTHVWDSDATSQEQRAAADRVSLWPARRHIVEKTILVSKGQFINEAGWKVLAEEQRAFISQMGWRSRLLSHAGMAGIAFLVTCAMAMYVIVYQPRIVRNHMRGLAIAGLLLAMLLLMQLAGLTSESLLLFGTAPVILVAMILAIAYDQRFAIGIGSVYGLLVTACLDQGTGFFLIVWAGVLMCCFLLDEVRTRGKLVEVGAITALAMILATAAVGAAALLPGKVIGRNCLFVGAGALGVGFIVLGLLPFIEKLFKITTSITLLELADVSKPLLRRLSIEAPGTYNHSLQVAMLAEAAAEVIGADSLLCRVGSYYHDIGKMNKAEYFVENQIDGRNRHLNLNPSVSLLIIIGHVKDGVELAREYHLPPAIIPIIQQHHGTTLVEYFYHQACKQSDASEYAQPAVSDTQYRYPGPKPRSRETAIIMISDVVESATRTIVEPTANRIEALVHDVIMKRLLDGQFDETDMTFHELQLIERTLVKTLMGIYHGRLAYPSTMGMTHGVSTPAAPAAPTTAVRSA
jgi:cyclic-di-AMP phosphodiesterase PgpH